MTDNIDSPKAMAERIRHLEVELKKLKAEIAKLKAQAEST